MEAVVVRGGDVNRDWAEVGRGRSIVGRQPTRVVLLAYPSPIVTGSELAGREYLELTWSNDTILSRLRANRVAIGVFMLLEALVLGQAFLAYQDQFFTLEQMQRRGVVEGLPFAWHFAMWSDLAIVSPLAAYLVGRFRTRWSAPSTLASLAIGYIISALLHWLYIFSTIPEAHIQDHKLTMAGVGHFFYMGLVVGVLTQFLVFTRDVPRRTLALVSLVLLLHVLVGTHMALGLLKREVQLDWYPAQPLRSFFGWATITVVAVGLLWRNLRDVEVSELWHALSEPHTKHPLLARFVDLFEFWTLQRFDTTERFFKALDYLASYVGFGAFFALVVAKVQISTGFKGGIFHLANWIAFAVDTALPCLLMLLFGSIYLFGRHSVRLELAIGPKLFPPDRVPKDWGSPKQRALVLITVVAFLLLFLVLTWFADNIKVASILMFVLACNDWRTRFLIQGGIQRYFADERYAPRLGDKDYALILARRAVADDFLFRKPHLEKETIRATGCGIAAGLAAYGYFWDVSWADIAAYLVLIVILLANEIATVSWRYRMFRAMKAVDDNRRQVPQG